MTNTIAWLDLETTGNKDGDQIIEVGMVLTDATPALNVIRTFREVIRPAAWVYVKAAMDPIVIEMHTQNGLIAEIDVRNPADRFMTQERILDFLGPSTKHIPLGGSGVCHFDRKYIRRDWPKVDKRFTYWSYDVGVMRRMARLAGLTGPSVDKPHRALDDALSAVNEARYYIKILGEAASKGSDE